MFVVAIVPLTRGITVESLSYFSSIAYEPGAIVTIPIRNSEVLGLVTDSKEVSTAKTALRAATFSLRKLPPQSKHTVLGSAYVATARTLSEYYAVPLGTILYNLLPPEIRNGDVSFPHTYHLVHGTSTPPEIFQASRKERFRAYRSLVRETFAHSGSVLCVAPSSIEADELFDILSQGISDRIIKLTTASTKSELKKAYTELEDFSKTKLIIATPSHAVIERHDITLTIVENARSNYYNEFTRPYLDYRHVLKTHAANTGRRIIFGDLLPRTEDEHLRRTEKHHTFGETPKRLELRGKLEIITTEPRPATETQFTLFKDKTVSAIKEARKRKGRIFIFAARRGLAPLVACLDCGFVFRSEESGAPYSLIRTTKNGVEERWFVCGTSGERIRASDICTACGSWRLRERGIGVQHVYDELHKLFPNAPLMLFDHITARTYKKATFLRENFYKTRGAIMLGTHMALPYLTQEIDTSVVVNMDALLATPTWRLEEENFALLLALREITTESLLIQTRSANFDLLNYSKQASVESFYTEELTLRKNYKYPPFTTFIHLTWQGTKEVVKEIETKVRTLLTAYDPSIYPNPTAPYESPIMYCLVRVPRDTWPDIKLANLLRKLPPSVRIMINPDKIV